MDLDSGMIEVKGHAQREQVVTKLVGLGYPELGNNHFISKTKSFVSCAIGKMSD